MVYNNYVKDLLKENGEFLSFNEFKEKIQVETSFLVYYGCISTIKSYMRKNKIVIESTKSINNNTAFSLFLSGGKGAKIFYDHLIRKAVKSVPKACKSWENLLGTEINWDKIFHKTKKIQDVKYQWFQIKINNRVLVNNSILKDMGVVTSNVCNFCELEKDTVYHYLWQCEHVQVFWSEFEKCLKEKCFNCDRLRLTPTLILLNHDNHIKTDAGFDYILLTAKFFVYKCRINKIRPRMQMFLRELCNLYQIDKYAHNILMKQIQFITKWNPYQQLISV